MKVPSLIVVAVAAVVAGCYRPEEKPAPLPTGDAWVESVKEWRAKHETDYRRDWATIAGLHFLQPGSHSLGSDKQSDIPLPEGVPADVGRIVVEDGWVRYEAAPGVTAQQNGKPVSGTVVLKEPQHDAADEIAVNDVKFAVHESG